MVLSILSSLVGMIIDTAMSHVAATFCSPTHTVVLPIDNRAADVLQTTHPPRGKRTWKKIAWADVNATLPPTCAGIRGGKQILEGVSRYDAFFRARRQVGDPSMSDADQAGTETTIVSGASGLTEGLSKTLPRKQIWSRSSGGEGTKWPWLSTTAESQTGVETSTWSSSSTEESSLTITDTAPGPVGSQSSTPDFDPADPPFQTDPPVWPSITDSPLTSDSTTTSFEPWFSPSPQSPSSSSWDSDQSSATSSWMNSGASTSILPADTSTPLADPPSPSPSPSPSSPSISSMSDTTTSQPVPANFPFPTVLPPSSVPITSVFPGSITSQPPAADPPPTLVPPSSVTITSVVILTSTSTINRNPPTLSSPSTGHPASTSFDPHTSRIPFSNPPSSVDTPSTVYPFPSISGLSSTSTSQHPQSSGFTSTRVVTTNLPGGSKTISTITETGTLITDTPTNNNNFSHNKGAIIGIAVSGAFALILLVFLIFFACKRYQTKRSYGGSTENMLPFARRVLWRPPLDGEEDESANYNHSSSPYQHHLELGGNDNRGEGGSGGGGGGGGAVVGYDVGPGGTGGRRSAEEGSAESANVGDDDDDDDAPALAPAFGGQPYMPGSGPGFGFGETTQHAEPVPLPFPSQTSAEGYQAWWGSNDPQTSYQGSRVPVTSHSRLLPGESRSAVSLGMAGASSSGDLGSTSRVNARRFSISPSPRRIPSPNDGRRSGSRPPSAFSGARDPNSDQERQQEQQDKLSVRSFLTRLRTGRRSSEHSIGTLSGDGSRTMQQGGRGSDDSIAGIAGIGTRVPSYVFSPSLLNPPIPITPPPVPTLLSHGGRGSVTGDPNYAPPNPAFYGYTSTTSSGILWPPATLPPAPSPVPSQDSSMVEGLLHPRLGMALAHSEQASAASFGDHEDYTRPLNGHVRGHVRSTTTFDTHGTVESAE